MAGDKSELARIPQGNQAPEVPIEGLRIYSIPKSPRMDFKVLLLIDSNFVSWTKTKRGWWVKISFRNEVCLVLAPMPLTFQERQIMICLSFYESMMAGGYGLLASFWRQSDFWHLRMEKALLWRSETGPSKFIPSSIANLIVSSAVIGIGVIVGFFSFFLERGKEYGIQ